VLLRLRFEIRPACGPSRSDLTKSLAPGAATGIVRKQIHIRRSPAARVTDYGVVRQYETQK
jgi:hypothetical protein